MFYDNYIKLCNKINKSPSACAEDMGLKRSVVSAWKNGRKPHRATLQKIADYFGCDISHLVDDLPMPAHPAYDKQLVELYWSLSPEGRDLLIDYAVMLQERYGQKNNPDLVKEITG